MVPLLLVLSLLTAGVPAHPAKPISAAEVARRLDVTSFPNSTGPRRRPGARTLRDYGFTKVELDGRSSVSLYRRKPGANWAFGIRVLSWSGNRGILCIEDNARNGGSYFVIKPLEVKEQPDGFLHATGRSIKVPECPVRLHR